MAFLRHIYKSYRGQTVLEDINLAINHGEVVALIGENGAGKTTLLEILRGELKPDAGSVQVSETVGYVPQEAVLGKTIAESFSATTESWKIDYALERVGMGSKKRSTFVSTLSGGQKTRLAFAVVLAQDPEPSLLLLDEPTNNLDTAGLEWLADFVRTFDGAVLLVSHDREFVNKTATKIAELHKTKLTLYGGNYDFYRTQKELEEAAAVARYQQHIEERNHLTKAITAQRENSKHAHEHFKSSDNDKMQNHYFKNRVTVKYGKQARMLEKRLDQLEEVERPESSKDYRIVLGGEVVRNKLVLRLEDICKGFPDLVLDKVNLEIRGGERIHVQGQNGSGKTTLLTIAARKTQPDSGGVAYGNGISAGYFSQNVDGLDHAVTGLSNLVATEATMTDIFREARSLGLTDTDLKKPVSELSRGQQAKLGFAKLLLASHHLLILDEPTNHLDIPTREQIESALQKYKGAVLFASHDKYFAIKLKPTKELQL
ncbi:ABC-F family ATP-binding cassette domain-containing protein [Candidatus Saccharibacteria bacterium]|nr:MAG: ABC-F family ATP-binding cassette domain-containing protein [Candidatus Saccharibacteria bacterium]